MPYAWIVIVLVLLLFLLISIYLNRHWKSELFKLNSQRPELNREQYIEMLINKGFDREHIEVVYDEIYNYLSIEGFSMYPHDDIHKLYRFEDLDDIELIDRICERLKLRMAEQKDFDVIDKRYNILNAESILALTKYLKEKSENNIDLKE